MICALSKSVKFIAKTPCKALFAKQSEANSFGFAKNIGNRVALVCQRKLATTQASSSSLAQQANPLGVQARHATPACRAKLHSASPCSQAALTLELNQILRNFQLSTKSWRCLAKRFPFSQQHSYRRLRQETLQGKLERMRKLQL